MRRKGFTLIELMIVVAICGILAAVAIPQFTHLVYKSRNQERARRGLPPLKDPTQTVEVVNQQGCAGSPISVTVDSSYLYTLYSSGCTDKKLK